MSDFDDKKKTYYHLRALEDEPRTLEQNSEYYKLRQEAQQVRSATFAQLGVQPYVPLTTLQIAALTKDIPLEAQRAPQAKGVMAGQYAVADSQSGLTTFLGTDYLMDCTGVALVGTDPADPAHKRIAVGHFFFSNSVNDSIDAMIDAMPPGSHIKAYIFNSTASDNPYGQTEIARRLHERGVRDIAANVDGPVTMVVHVPTGTMITSEYGASEMERYDTRGAVTGAALDLMFPHENPWPMQKKMAAFQAYRADKPPAPAPLSKIHDDRAYMTDTAQLVSHRLGLSLNQLQEAIYPYPSDSDLRWSLQTDKSDTLIKLATVLPNMDQAQWKNTSLLEKKYFVRQVQVLPLDYWQTAPAAEIANAQRTTHALVEKLPPPTRAELLRNRDDKAYREEPLYQMIFYPEAWSRVGDPNALPKDVFDKVRQFTYTDAVATRAITCADVGAEGVQCPVTPPKPKVPQGRPH